MASCSGAHPPRVAAGTLLFVHLILEGVDLLSCIPRTRSRDHVLSGPRANRSIDG